MKEAKHIFAGRAGDEETIAELLELGSQSSNCAARVMSSAALKELEALMNAELKRHTHPGLLSATLTQFFASVIGSIMVLLNEKDHAEARERFVSIFQRTLEEHNRAAKDFVK